MKNKKIAVMAITAFLAIGSAMTGLAGQWQQDDKGWRYQNEDGSYVAQDGIYNNGNLYRFDENGYMVTGWLLMPMDLSQASEEYKQEVMEATHDYGGYWSYYKPDGSMVWYNYTPEGYWIEASGYWDFRDANPSAAENRNNASNNPTPVEEEEIPEDGFNYEYAEEVLELVNEEREKEGLEPLEMTAELNEAAETRAEEFADEFEQTGTITHTRPDGSSFSSILKHIPHKLVAENGSKGALTPKEVVGDWMGSRIGHKQNILTSSFEQIGIGCYVKDGNYFWCQLFIQTK